jgi:hypothetical protein
MNNTTELTAELKEIFAKVKDRKIGLKEAKVLVATDQMLFKWNTQNSKAQKMLYRSWLLHQKRSNTQSPQNPQPPTNK